MVDLTDVKRHAKIFDEDTHFDAELQDCLDAAKDHLTSIDVEMSSDPLPPAIKHAILMLAIHFFDHKGATSEEKTRSTPLGVDRLITPYRRISL